MVFTPLPRAHRVMSVHTHQSQTGHHTAIHIDQATS